MRAQTTVQLLGGWLDAAGVCHQEATVRPLRGRDEEWLYGLPPHTPLAPLVTELLLRCVGRVGPSRPTRATIRSLLVADRNYLVLKLHQATFGSRVDMVLTCPRPACGARMDVDFQIDALPVRRDPQQPSYRLEHDREEVPEVRFQLPNGADLEALAAGGGGAGALLERCVLVGAEDASGPPASGPPGWVGELPENLRASLEAEMERRSPGVEREIEATCPECGHAFEAAYDPVRSFLAEVWRGRGEFDREVHLLSFHYHWPLREILGMTRLRRQAYVALLLRQLDQVGAAVMATG
ncbi:MAG: hypothetical protein ACM3ML_08160 [Micromonosporaceae bacterium]